MTDSSRPEPLVPADVDLRGLEYMPLLGGKLFGSDFNLDANDTEFRVAVRLWWAAWNQVPAGSLPGLDARVRNLAGLEENPSKWKKVRERVLHGFFECTDGRLYHKVLAQQALIAWEKRAESIAERDNEAERQRRVRAERKRLFEELRGVGVTPKYDIKMDDLRALVTEHVTRTVTPSVTVTQPAPVTVTVTQTHTAKTGRDGTGQEIQERARVDATTLRALAEGTTEPEDPAIGAGTRYGLAARAMRQKGCAATPGDPRLRQLVDQGASLEEFEAVGAEAAEKSKGPAWALTALINRRAEAATVQLAAAPAPPPWHETRAGVSQRGQELGVGAWPDVENASIRKGVTPSYAAYRTEVIAAHNAAGGST